MSQQALAAASEQNVVAADSNSINEVIARAASDPNTDVDKLERLMAMAERMEARQAERAYNDAMNAAQEEMRPISQDASNPQTRSKYASFAALDKALRPIYTKHGFSMSFDTADGAPESYVRVVCKVSHKGGHSESPHLDMPADGKGAKGGDVMTKTHAVMSAVSYAKRGLEKMVWNIAEGDADDDGNAAGAGPKINKKQTEMLQNLITVSGADIERFCRYMNVEALPDIPAKDYDRALAALNKRNKEAK